MGDGSSPMGDGERHVPERSIQTGIGALDVRRPKVRDRASDVADEKKIRFTSAILPSEPCAATGSKRLANARRSKSLDALLPVLYLRGLSMGDFQEALSALLGPDAPNLSPSVISWLTGEWQQEYDHWQRRDLSARRYVYMWADGVYLQARMEPQAECMLVILEATPEGSEAENALGRRFPAERARRLPGGRSRERAELARTAGRHQGSRPQGAARDCRR